MTIAEALPDLAPEIARLTLHRLISTLPLPTTDTAVDRAEREAEAIAALAPPASSQPTPTPWIACASR